MHYSIEPVAVVRSPYQEKFAIPRQPGLVPAARGEVVLLGAYNNGHCVQGLEEFSHIWLSFIFHQTLRQGWKPLVRPPRLGGNKKVGVFASRSTFRPNGIGLSVVQLDSIEHRDGHWRLLIRGFDLLDQTPVVDIKPYIPYSDALTEVKGGYAAVEPTQMAVRFSSEVEPYFNHHRDLAQLVREVLAQDPRPAYRAGKDDAHTYGVKLANRNINWVVEQNVAVVTAVSDC